MAEETDRGGKVPSNNGPLRNLMKEIHGNQLELAKIVFRNLPRLKIFERTGVSKKA